MEYINNTLCLAYSELVSNGLLTKTNWDYHRRQGNFVIYGRGGKGVEPMVEFESLPKMIKTRVLELYPNPYEHARRQPLLNLLKTDNDARDFFRAYQLEDGRSLPNGLDEKGNYNAENNYQGIYARQADWLNLVNACTADLRGLRDIARIQTIGELYPIIIELHKVDHPINPYLPTSEKRLREKLNKYRDGGYESLVEVHKFFNSNARKVDASIEQLILAMYCQPYNPTAANVCRDYVEFMAGRKIIVDLDTGEAFDPAAYWVDGKPYEVKPSTVKHYISKPLNKVTVLKHRVSDYEYRMKVAPHHNRKAPIYALSKITMDDTSSPFKMYDGKRPATYKIFDVASQALIAIAMTKDQRPDSGLVRQVLKKMLRLVVQKSWGMPHEVEVENAINKSLTGKKVDGNFVADVLTAGAVFHMIHFCAPKNPQEKAAERFIKEIKYGYQKHRDGFQARPFAMLDANRMNEDRDKTMYTFEEIEAMEHADAWEYNNALHPNQDLYPQLTRWQVLEQHQNPNLKKPALSAIMPLVGDKVPRTTIKRGFLDIKGVKFQLPTGSVAASLHDETVTAYYLPNENGSIPRAWLYQDAEFVSEAIPVVRYQQSTAEATAEDYKVREAQKQYKKEFEEAVAGNAAGLPRVGVIDNTAMAELRNGAIEDAQVIEYTPADEAQADDEIDYNDPDAVAEWARKSI